MQCIARALLALHCPMNHLLGKPDFKIYSKSRPRFEGWSLSEHLFPEDEVVPTKTRGSKAHKDQMSKWLPMLGYVPMKVSNLDVAGCVGCKYLILIQ